MSNKKRFRKYNGPDKYHFRVYQKLKHPFIVTKIDYSKHSISGYILTTSPLKNKRYYKLKTNPNKNDTKLSYVTSHRIVDNWDRFSRPFNNWHLNPLDEKIIDLLEKRRSDVK